MLGNGRRSLSCSSMSWVEAVPVCSTMASMFSMSASRIWPSTLSTCVLRSSMVLISSRAAKTGFAALGVNTGATKAHYCASKAGVISLTKSLATELARHAIRVNGIAPGPIEGTMIPSEQWNDIASRVPLGRLGRPEEIAETAHFLCSQQAGYITGHILDVNGGTLMD